MTINGIDVSQYQGVMSWAKAASRLGEGGFTFIRAADISDPATLNGVDRQFVANWAGAKAAGLKRGVYLVFNPARSLGDQLMLYLSTVNADWGELPPALDLELGSSVWTLAQNKGFQWICWVLEKCSGRVPLIYTSQGYWNGSVAPSPSGNPVPASKDNSWAAHYGLWVANYTHDASIAPLMPSAWKTYQFYQYSNKGVGADYGAASATIDLDVAHDPSSPPVVVPPATPAITFSASKTALTAGQSVTFQWAVDGVQTVHFFNGAELLPVGGHDSRTLAPTQAVTCHLEVLGRDGLTYRSQSIAISVTPAPSPPATDRWCIDYYAGIALAGNPIYQQIVFAVNFDWGTHAPDAHVPSDLFSARAVKNFTSEASTYLFSVTADDGVRLYVDDALVIDHWIEQPATTYSAYLDMTAGAHTLKVEYFDKGGLAVLRVAEPVKASRPPVVVTGAPPPKVGLHTVENWDAAKAVSALGCRSHTIMDGDVAETIKAAHPDAIVVKRHYLQDWTMEGAAVGRRYGLTGHGVIDAYYNEQDNFAYGTEAEIRNRVDQELRLADYLLALNTEGGAFTQGEFSQGCPDFTEQYVIDQVSRFAPYYNNHPNVYFSMHPYSPTPDSIYGDIESMIWYERRWVWLFTHCGFNPNLRKIIFTEYGLDQHSGFKDHGFTGPMMAKWIARSQEVQSAPLIVPSGRWAGTYPSPVIAQNYFQWGEQRDQKWFGFGMEPYKDQLVSFWARGQ